MQNVPKPKDKSIARISKSSVLFPFRLLAKSENKIPAHEESTAEYFAYLRKEVEDLKMNLKLNKDSLTVMLSEL